MDQRFTAEQPMTPDEVRSYLWRWIVANLVEAQRMGRRAMRQFTTVLEPGDALSVVEEAVEVVAELAARRPVYASGVVGLLSHQVPWVAARRARVLRPLAELPSGLGRTDATWLEVPSVPSDGLSLALGRRPVPMLSEEVRAASALEMVERLSLRLRGALTTGIGELADHLRPGPSECPAPVRVLTGSAWRKRVERGREALLRWASVRAIGAERELLTLLMRRGRQSRYRNWRARLLDQLGLDLTETPAWNVAEGELVPAPRPEPVQP